MKKILIIVFLLFLAIAAAVFYVFSKNRQAFMVPSSPEQIMEDAGFSS